MFTPMSKAAPQWFEVKSEEVIELYTKRAERHREKAAKCEQALSVWTRDGDARRAIAEAFGSEFASRPLMPPVPPYWPTAQEPEEQLRSMLKAAIDHNRKQADQYDWFAKHVAPNEKFKIDEATWRTLINDGCGCGGVQVQAARGPLDTSQGGFLADDLFG